MFLMFDGLRQVSVDCLARSAAVLPPDAPGWLFRPIPGRGTAGFLQRRRIASSAPEARWFEMQVHDSLIELMGDTPLVRLRKVTRGLAVGGRAPDVLAKVEYFNPGGSVKDRIALRMVEAAEASGALRPGGTIVEPTSGNTGIGLAIVAAEKGYRCVFVCPDKVAGTRSACCARTGQTSWCARRPSHRSTRIPTTRCRPAGRRDPGGWKPEPVRQPGEPSLALPHHRPGDLGADRG